MVEMALATRAAKEQGATRVATPTSICSSFAMATATLRPNGSVGSILFPAPPHEARLLRDPRVPSLLHEELLLLLRREPLFALTALQRPGGLELPPFTSIAVVPGEIRQLLATERRADIVVLMRDDEPVFAIVIEVQTSIDADKRWTWPLYLAALGAEHRCPVALVVFAIDPAIRRWAATPIFSGHPGHTLVPLSVGPADIPRVTDEQEARENPYRAILSALVHALEPGAEHLVLAAFRGADTLPKADADTWRELLAEAIKNNDVARRAVEALMDIPNFRDRSAWYKEGREQATRDAIARVLARRGLALDPSHQARLAECSDMVTLDQWLDEAVSAASAEEALR